MSFGLGGGDIRPEQGPPLAIPVRFFVLAPLAMAGAGVYLLLHATALTSRWLSSAMVLTHIGTLGLLAPVMLGALYQMLPVVAGAPVPFVRLAHAVHVALVGGLLALLTGFQTERALAFAVGGSLLGVAFVLFLLQAGLALHRTETRSATVTGIRLALVGLALTVGAGLVLVLYRAGVPMGGDQLTWNRAHLALGGIVWVGGLITSVSWQVVPMFYLTDAYPRWVQRMSLIACGATALGLVVALTLGSASSWLVWVAVPGALAVWVLNPVTTVRLVRRRRRARVGGSLRFWYAGSVAALVLFAAVFALLPTDYPHAAVFIGWTAVWGWAGMIVHGMLTRIVPFLVWFHRYSKRVGIEPVPTMRQLLPTAHVAVGFALHTLTLVVGWAAIVAESPGLARCAGIGLLATGVTLATELARALWPRHARR